MADDKPPFNPNQPFEVVKAPAAAKPAFDPSKPFTTVGKIPEQGQMSYGESFMSGLSQPISGGKQLGAHMLGTPEQAAKEDLRVKGEEAEFARRGGSPLARGLGAATTTLPIAAVAGPASLPGAVVGGAAVGAVQPTQVPQRSDYVTEKAKQMAIDSLFGAGTGLFGRAASPGLSPQARALSQSGVQLTPGQMMGGQAQRFEEAAASYPILGQFIRGAQGRGNEALNRAVANQVLEPIGQNLNPRTPVGRAAVDEVYRKVTNSYDQLLPQISLTYDHGLTNDLSNTLNRAQIDLSTQQFERFRRMLGNRLEPIFRFQPQPGVIQPNGQIVKAVDSQLRYLAERGARSPDMQEQLMGEMFGEARTALRQTLIRQNPQQADALRAVDTAYAMFKRMEKASTRRATGGGEFTPADLINAISSAERRRGAFSRGDALMQTYAEAANAVLPSNVKGVDIGDRIVSGQFASRGGSVMDDLLKLGLLSTAGLPYSRPIMAVTNALARSPTGAAIRRGAPYAAPAGAIAGNEATYGGPQE